MFFLTITSINTAAVVIVLTVLQNPRQTEIGQALPSAVAVTGILLSVDRMLPQERILGMHLCIQVSTVVFSWKVSTVGGSS